MISLHRTTDSPPLAVLRHGQGTLLFPWADLLALRTLAQRVDRAAAHDEDFPRVESEPWAASGSSFGIALMREGLPESHWEAEDWEELQRLLHIHEPLVSPTDAATVTGQPRSRIGEAIARGDLFAFQLPGKARRQWKIPLQAAQAWARRRTQ